MLHKSSISNKDFRSNNYSNHFNKRKEYRYLMEGNKGPIPYYSNSKTTFNVILESNDTEKNPGSTQVKKAHSCDSVIRSNLKRCICICCSSLTHQKFEYSANNKTHQISI